MDDETYRKYKPGRENARPIDLRNEEFDIECLKYVTENLARRYHTIPIRYGDHGLICAVPDVRDQELYKILAFVAGCPIHLVQASLGDIEWAIDEFYFVEDDADAPGNNNEDIPGTPEHNNDQLEELGKRMPTVRLVQGIIARAIHCGASDIHIHPEEKYAEILFRIDGSLIQARKIGIKLLSSIVSRIKIIGNMDISERRVPQDGRAKYQLGGKRVELRISVMPTVTGESVVIRILDSEIGLKPISELGLSERDIKIITGTLNRSSGLLLVTGPTGSGKSTTLYSFLQEVVKRNPKIITVENPVEYQIKHIEQIQVNPAIGYDFARALRNILRHDPDVIMIGEIRDQETAKIAVENALTGHLVLSTLHTNDAVSAITRLMEIGIPSYLVASTVSGVLAQRLVKRNCQECLDKEDLQPEWVSDLGIDQDEIFYKGQGCKNCSNTGYKGRMAVYELLRMDKSLMAGIHANHSEEQLRELAINQGMESLTNFAIDAARQKKTSLAEAYRVRLEN